MLDMATSMEKDNSAPQGAHGPDTPLFRYKPLDTSIDSIRLLVLHGAPSPDLELSCSLLHTNFADCPQYEALSYQWGNPESPKSLQVEGASLPIGENLHEALMHIRLKEDCTLWIDAICINQEDLAERQYQVGLMDFIYHPAERVLVWLGIPIGDLIIDVDKSPDRRELEQMETFCTWSFDHTYWTRVWIVQEIALARQLTVCVGTRHIPWLTYLSALKAHHSFRTLGEKIQKLDEKRRGRHGPSNRLEQLLADFQGAQCRETRDKIYGFLGLAHDWPPDLRADYSKSLFDIYAEVLRTFSQPQTLPNGGKNTVDRMMRLVGYSQLVQRLLSPELPQSPFVASTGDQSQFITARGAMTNRIIHLGPPCDRIIASSAANKQWTQSFSTHFSLPQDVRFLREANEAYFPMIKGMNSEETAKFRVLDPQQLYSRGTPAGAVWRNAERMWSHLAGTKEEYEKEITTGLFEDIKAASLKAIAALDELEDSYSKTNEVGSVRPLLNSLKPPRSRRRRKSRSRYGYIASYSSPTSSSSSDSMPRSRFRPPSTYRKSQRSPSRRRIERTRSSPSRSRSPSSAIKDVIKLLAEELTKERTTAESDRDNRSGSRSKPTRTRSQETHRVGSSRRHEDPAPCPADDVSSISFPQQSQTSHSPRLFLGDNGIIGLAPPEAEVGDIICQFWGTNVTALLREEPQPRTPPNDPAEKTKKRRYVFRTREKITQEEEKPGKEKGLGMEEVIEKENLAEDEELTGKEEFTGKVQLTRKQVAEKPSHESMANKPTEYEGVESEASRTSDTESDNTQPEVKPPELVYRIMGRVHLSTGYLKHLKPMYRKYNKPPDGSKCVDITMSIHTLAHLTTN